MKRAWFLILLFLAAVRASAAEPVMRVHYIDVGQAASTLLEFPCGAMLIDAGAQDEEHVEALKTYLKEFFGRRSDLNNTLNALVISHPHIDHTMGVEAVFSICRVKTYIDDGLVRVHDSGHKGVQFARDHARDHGTVVREIRQSEIDRLPGKTGLTDGQIDSIACADCDPEIRILGGSRDEQPDPEWSDKEFNNPNNHSVVLRVDFGESSFLFTGDLERPALETLVSFYDGTDLLDVDVLLVGHHGSHNGTTSALLEAVTPDVAVIGVGRSTYGAGDPKHINKGFNTVAFGHPRRSVIDLLSDAIPGPRSHAIRVEVADKAAEFSDFLVTKRIYATGWDGHVIITADLDKAMRVTTIETEDLPPVAATPTLALAAGTRSLDVPAAAPSPRAAPAAQVRYRWNLTIPEKKPVTGGNGKLVLFDVSHGGTAGLSDWVIDGGFSDFADALVKEGYTVREYRGIDKDGDGAIRFFDDRPFTTPNENEATIEFSAIKDAAVFVMAETNRPLRKDERDALVQFVEAGKGLFVIADHYNADRNLNSWDATEVLNGYNRSTSMKFDLGGRYGDMRNPGDAKKGWLAENFGLRFRFNAIDCKKGASDVRPPADTEQITQGVKPILMAASSTLAIIDPAKAKGIVYLKESDPAKSWSKAVEGPTRGLYLGGAKEGPFAAIAKRGRGKAAFMGDSSPVEDSTPKYLNEQGGKKGLHNGWNSPGTASVLCLNIIQWLANEEHYQSFDGTNGHAAGTLTPDPLVVAEQSDPDDGEPWKPLPRGYDPWNTDTYARGSFGAPLPAGSIGGTGNGSTPTTTTTATTVAQALQTADGRILTVKGVIQGEFNDQFGLRLADSQGASSFLAVQLAPDQRPSFSPQLKPSIRGQRVQITGKRGRYAGLPGLRDVRSIELVNP